MAKVIFINRFFHPDESATSQILSDLAFTLAEEGHVVHALTSRNRLVGKDGRLRRHEIKRGVTIHRVGHQPAQSAGLLSRVLAFAMFYASAALVLRRQATEGCIVVAMTDPPLLSVWAHWLLRGRRVDYVNWFQDVYPEVAISQRIRFVRGRLGRRLMDLRDRSLKRATANVVLGARMSDHMESRGAPKASLHVVPNWVDDRTIRPVHLTINPLRRQWGLADKFVVAYSGNLGRVHEFGTLLAAAERFRGRDDLRFLFIGGGFHRVKLRSALQERGLERLALFKPYQEQSNLACSLGAANAHWLSLRPEFENLIVPSKFYGIAAAGRPIIAIVDPNGEVAALVKRFNCGAVVEPGDGAGLARLLEVMISDRAPVEEWGRNARAMIEIQYSRAHAIEKWREIIGAKKARSPSSPERAAADDRRGLEVAQSSGTTRASAPRS